MDMAISPASPAKLRAATFGRGVYEGDIGTTTGIIPSSKGSIKFIVFPNPSSELLNIKINVSKETDFEFEIANTDGSVVLKKTCRLSAEKSEQQINLSSFSNAIYFLKIISKEGNSELIKIIKQ